MQSTAQAIFYYIINIFSNFNIANHIIKINWFAPYILPTLNIILTYSQIKFFYPIKNQKTISDKSIFIFI